MSAEWSEILYEDILDADVIDDSQRFLRFEGHNTANNLFGFPIHVSNDIPPNCMRLVDRRTGKILYERCFESEEEYNRFMDDVEKDE